MTYCRHRRCSGHSTVCLHVSHAFQEDYHYLSWTTEARPDMRSCKQGSTSHAWVCASRGLGCRQVASWECGAYVHCPGTGCFRPSALSLVPESSCLAASSRGRAFFGFPAGLSSSRLRSCHSKPVRRLHHLIMRQCPGSHAYHTLSESLQLIAISMPHTSPHHAPFLKMFRTCPTCCLRPRAALAEATFGFPSAIRSSRDCTNGPS